MAAEQKDVGTLLGEVLAVLTPVLDIVAEPVEEPVAPRWCAARGWTDFLLSLSDAELADAETRGLESSLGEHARAPRDLRALLAAARAGSVLPRLATPPQRLPDAALRRVPARKREQLSALLGAVTAGAARAERIVDVGSGSGHFSRLAAELFGREVVALDRNELLLRTGTLLHEQRERDAGALAVRFVHTDLSRHELELRPTDLAVGLHACGELGDRLVRAAAAVHCELAVVSCCLQKTQAETRAALSHAGGTFSLARAALGLTNLTPQAEGVEASLADNLRARELRLALRRLLRARGLDVRVGEEMRGLNRRRAQGTLLELASRALAERGLEPTTPSELEFHGANARRDQATIRRLSLPRTLLGRIVELAIVFDRGTLLEEAGLHVQVAELFERRVTPRNTLLLAQ